MQCHHILQTWGGTFLAMPYNAHHYHHTLSHTFPDIFSLISAFEKTVATL